LLISVENRSRPNWTPKAGVTVPWTIAWTAMGITGVGVTVLVGRITAVGVIELVGEALGEGVISTTVGVSAGGTAVSVGAGDGGKVAVSDASGASVGGGAAGTAGCSSRPNTSRATASAPESTDSRTDPRACTMYRRRRR
jgi:hypothetical protein